MISTLKVDVISNRIKLKMAFCEKDMHVKAKAQNLLYAQHRLIAFFPEGPGSCKASVQQSVVQVLTPPVHAYHTETEE